MPALTTAAAIASPLIGALMSAQAQRDQQNIAIANFNAQQAEQFAARDQAERALQLQLAPQTDARGNTTRFGGPGVGFVTDLSPITQQLIGASDQAELADLIQQNFQTQEENSNRVRRGREGNLADTLLQQLQQPSTSRGEIEADLLLAGRAGANSSADEAISGAYLAALRGDVDPTQFIREVNNTRNDQLESTAANARVASRGAAQSFDANEQTTDGNLFNLLASRASNVQDTPFRPSPLAAILSQQSASTRNVLPQVSSLGVSAAARPGGRIDPRAFGYNPNVARGIGSVLAGIDGAVSLNQRSQRNENARGNVGRF